MALDQRAGLERQRWAGALRESARSLRLCNDRAGLVRKGA